MPRPDSYLHSIKIQWYLEGTYPAQRTRYSHIHSVLVIYAGLSTSSQTRKRTSCSTGFSLWHNIYTASMAKWVVEGFAAPRRPPHIQAYHNHFCSLPDTEQTPNSSSCIHKLPPLGRGLYKGVKAASEHVKNRSSPPFLQMDQKVSHKQIINKINHN